MRNGIITLLSISLAALIMSSCSGRTVTKLADTDTLLKNPGKGLVLRGWCSDTYDDEYYDMCSVDYERFDWCQIEPEEGVYEWSLIDEYITAATEKGLKFAFGVMTANTSSENVYVTPKWVFDAGAKCTFVPSLASDGHDTVCPDWTDEIFLEKLDTFVAALGERYDGDENIAYVDIRSYGNWGEEHLYGLEDSGYDYISSEALKEDYIMPYVSAFPNTQLINACNGSLYWDVYEWSVTKGMGLRRDGIMGYSNGYECALAYGKAPAIYEIAYGVSYHLKNGTWDMDELETDIETGMASYLEFPYAAYEVSADDFAKFANKIGYYFRLRKAVIYNKISDDGSMKLELTVCNDGVAPLYEKAILKIGFFDENDNLVTTVTTDENPQKWEPGESRVCRIELDGLSLESGKYTAAVGLFLNEDDMTPDYQLGSEGSNGDNWYEIGGIEVD